MVIENATSVGIPVITPLINTIQVLVGGIFGLYLILTLLRLKEYMMVRKFLEDMRHDLLQISKKLGVRVTSEKRPKGFKRFRIKAKK